MNFRVFILSLVTFAVGTASFIVTGVLGDVAESLGVSVGTAGPLVSVFAVVFAALSPVLVAVTTRVERRRLLVAALILFALSNAAGGDGTLSTEEPLDEPEDLYLYDPRNPVPTVGGATLLGGATNVGPRDQRGIEARADVLCYTTPPLESRVEVTGPVALLLYISSSARDTDFTGKLVDVHPDGRAENLTDGIIRTRYRASFGKPEFMEPDEIYEVCVDLWATSNVFLPGHRIRLEVSSSNFPRFDRNTNTGGTIFDETEADLLQAVNRTHHNRAYPSRLVLPIIARD